MAIEQAPQEADDEQQVLLAIGQLRAVLGLVESRADVSDVVAQGWPCLAG